MFKKLLEKLYDNPVSVLKGDSVLVTYTDTKGVKTELGTTNVTTTFKIEKLEILEVQNELGLSKGLCATFGEIE